MRPRVAVLSFTLFIILASQISLLLASSSSTKVVVTSGIIKSRTLSKHLIAWSSILSDELANFIANHFHLVVIGYTPGWEKIKLINPRVVLLAYKDIMAVHTTDPAWDEVNAHEDWFLHDVNGNRLIHKVYGWYAMDVGNHGWRDHFANYVKAKLDKYPSIDGIFADDVWEWYDYRNEEFTVDASLVPKEIQQRWHNDMVGMIQYVKGVLANKLLMLNSDDWSGDYLRYADGMVFEGFVHASWWALDYFGWAGFDPLSHVDILRALSSTGKYILAWSGARIPDNPTQTDLEKAHKLMLYCLGSALLGANSSNVFFGWVTLHTALDGSRGYYQEMDCYIGAPKGKYFVKDGLYIRDFEYGWVLVNFSTDTRSTVIEGKTYTLEPRSAIIIEK